MHRRPSQDPPDRNGQTQYDQGIEEQGNGGSALATRHCVCTLHSLAPGKWEDAKLFPEKHKRADSRKAVSPACVTGTT